MNITKSLILALHMQVISSAVVPYSLADIQVEIVEKIQKRKDHLKEQADVALQAFSRFCSSQKWDCSDDRRLRVTLTDQPILSEAGHAQLAGRFTPSTESILVSTRSQEIPASLFHELIHWAHYQRLGRPGWFTSPPAEFEWVLEAVPFVAALRSGVNQNSLTGAEAKFIGNRLSGSLLTPSDGADWYGLVGLWTRYLSTHLQDPQSWFENLSRATPQIDSLDFISYRFLGEERQVLGDVHKRFENIFEYFILSLIENSAGVNVWNLFLLDRDASQTPILAEPSRWSVFRTEVSATLAARSFFFVLPQKVPEGYRFTAGEGIRIVLWRGTTRPPIDLLVNDLPPRAEIKSAERILIYNAGAEPAQYELRARPGALPPK